MNWISPTDIPKQTQEIREILTKWHKNTISQKKILDALNPKKKNNTTKEILSESLINMLNIFRESKIDTNSHVKRSDI